MPPTLEAVDRHRVGVRVLTDAVHGPVSRLSE